MIRSVCRQMASGLCSGSAEGVCKAPGEYEMTKRQDERYHYALILAGGKSSRMGREKALIPMGGETLLTRAVRFWNLSGLADRILLSAGSPDRLTLLKSLPEGVKPVFDSFEDSGPMAGILSAFRQTDAELLYVSAVDMPYLSRDAAETLLHEISEMSAADRLPDAAVFLRAGRPEPLFGIYRRSAADAAERLLRSGNRKMSRLLNSIETVYCPTDDGMEKIFQNINTPEDLRNLTGWRE